MQRRLYLKWGGLNVGGDVELRERQRREGRKGYRTLKETGSSELCKGYLHSYVRHTSTCTSHSHAATHT